MGAGSREGQSIECMAGDHAACTFKDCECACATHCEHRDIDEHAICLDCGTEGYYTAEEGMGKTWHPKK